jgi:uncharacterized protein (UPF0147 family)
MTPYHWIIGLMFGAITGLIGLVIGSMNVTKKIECLRSETDSKINPIQQLIIRHDADIHNLSDRATENKTLIIEFTKATTIQVAEVVSLLKEIVSQNNILIHDKKVV